MPIIIVIIVIALIVAAIVTVVRMAMNGSSGEGQTNTKTATLQESELNREASRSVRWTVRGPIVADENFRSYQITVTPNSRTFVTYSGYLEQVMDTKKYDNNTKAYEEFVYALDKANIGATRDAKDEEFRGVCATKGVAYMFETLNNSEPDNTVWSSSSKDSAGTMGADPLKVQALFVNQIPDFNPLFNKVF